MAEERKRFLLFKTLIAVGFLLGIVLLLQTVTTYRYVSGAMILQEAERDSQRKVNTLVGAVRSARTQEIDQINAILLDFLQDWNEQVAWVRIVDGRGQSVASAGQTPPEPVAAERLPRPFSAGSAFPERRETPAGTVLVSIRSFRTTPLFPPPPGGERGTAPQRGGRGFRPPSGQNWNIEIALFPDAVSGSFAGLRRNLIVGLSASFALMGALVLIAVRFPFYVRGQQIQRELNLARRVQADLLPSAETISPYVDFSAECISAWQVGGDFCDVFHVAEDRTALVLGDVSGKGISAALLMALVHGAMHSVAWTRSTQDHVTASRQLNTLLYKKTASERFASLFWGCFDPQRSTIQYVNAGHLPPLLLRMTNGELETRRLDVGGTVMGLLPDANYQQGEEYVAPGDLLVAFSDGVIEATNANGEEFGDARLISIVGKLWNAPANDIRAAIHSSLREFTGDTPVGDDRTLIVVRFRHSETISPESRSSAVSAA